ncbi:MAG TPA: hypothetical protein VK760_00150 [Candidatus Acidoferrales bacterium]|nr:hypothetical protein [Candidatus Acidoferrales bacterium]
MHLPHDLASIGSGCLGAMWLIGLWYAAPLLPASRTPAARLAATIALGCGIPLALGFANLLYAWSLWTVLLVLLALRLSRGFGMQRDRDPARPVPWDLLAGFATLLCLAWPLAVRPAIDGDTLIYHLPNAAAWVAHHGLWVTGTRYWWYPPASEIFASGLLATGGLGVVGWAGLLPAALLILTVRTVAERNGLAPIVGTLAGSALTATPVVAAQLVSLQNDVWQAALFAFALTEFSPVAVGVLALTKPNGFVYAMLSNAPWLGDRRRILTASAVAIGIALLWFVRDLVLAPRAIVPIWTSTAGAGLATTIAAHLPHALAVLVTASWNAGLVWTLFFASGIAAMAYPRQPFLRWAALTSLAIFFFVPTGYEGTIPQLATGASLRYALPFCALGAFWLAAAPRKLTPLLIAAACVAVSVGVAAQWTLFYNDATTHDTPIVVLLATAAFAAIAAIGHPGVRKSAGAALLVALAALAGGLAESHPADYVVDAFGKGGGFAFVASNGFANVVTLGLPAGSIITVDPKVDAFDGTDQGSCEEARRLHAVILASSDRLKDVNCGTVLFRDDDTAVVDPAR